ncbi:MAG TPA: molybdopterin-binding protein [Bradyrhizobium sp.]|uniref:molybdopterin-binding protein n=1 Tax=Bradyrhizobium sp. TaxID=376 RepID=UPI002BB57ECD|nr:molybdopterin-binding protein [Bradyrhizobium sp.]HLZ03099.1 molybdopterin-binding protein [Bradyrhizobium sp.]
MDATQRLPASLTPLDVALAALLRDVAPVSASKQARHDAHGRESSEIPELAAWPPHDIAASDGWALRASDLVGASSYTPLPLSRSPVWVEAGDKIPDGCDCVLDEDSIERTGPIAQVLAEAIPGQGIRRKSGKIADPGRIVAAWRLSSLCDAACRPRLRVVNSPGGAITAKLIAKSLREAGVEIVFVEASARDAASIAPLLAGSDCDLILTIGGSGVGRTDAAVIALTERGEVIAHGLALQPGRTAAVGRIGRTPVVVMPGAPDQALAVWWTLVLPALDRLAGWQHKAVTRPLARKIASSVGIAEVVLLEEQDGAWLPLAVGDLPFGAIARAGAWLLVPGGSEGYAAGTPVDAYLLRE